MKTDGATPSSQSQKLTRLSRLDHCHDRDDPDGILIVLEVLDETAAEYELTDGVTVADVHDGYPPHDPVVVTIYERTLDTYRDVWNIDSPHITQRLRDVGADLFYYPAGKLDLYEAGNYTELPEGTRCEHCETMLDGTTGWVEHVARDCPYF